MQVPKRKGTDKINEAQNHLILILNRCRPALFILSMHSNADLILPV